MCNNCLGEKSKDCYWRTPDGICVRDEFPERELYPEELEND